MDNNSFYTADGFCDTIPAIASFKKEKESTLRNLFKVHGYNEIETPGLEFSDVYTKGDFVSEKELYKIVDQKGRLLALRYDGTIPAARCVATILKDEPLPLRLFYIENMYRFNEVGGGKQSEFTQAGIELLGADTSFSDAEVIILAIKSALAIGIKDLQISLGQVKIFEGVMRQLKIGKDDSALIGEAIRTKNVVTLDKLAQNLNLSDTGLTILQMMMEGEFVELDEFKNLITDDIALRALDNLYQIKEYLSFYGYDKYISLDIGLIDHLNYYTGMMFRGFTYEVGFPIISGGRYDNTVGVFGKEMKAVGFSLGLSLAVIALLRQGLKLESPKVEILIGFDKNNDEYLKNAIVLTEKLRNEGRMVILDVCGKTYEELDKFAEDKQIETVIYINADYKGEN